MMGTEITIVSTSKVKGRTHAEDVQDGTSKCPQNPLYARLALGCVCSPPGKTACEQILFFTETTKHLRIPFNTCCTRH